MATRALGDAAIPGDIWGLAALAGKEMLVGMAFAFGIAALFAALSAAGAMLDLSIGFMLGGVIDPLAGHAVVDPAAALHDGRRDRSSSPSAATAG